MKKQYLAALLLASGPIWAGASTTDNLVKNGSFESYAVGNNSWSTFYGPSSNGWSTGDAGVEIRNNAVGQASDGVKFAELDTKANSSIFQSISTVAGQQYLLTFDYSNRTGTEVSTNGLAWSFGDTTGTATSDIKNTSGGNQWLTFSQVVTATSANTLLSFFATGKSDSYGSSLDNISLTAVAPVPEPASIALFMAGLGALGIVSRRRKQA